MDSVHGRKERKELHVLLKISLKSEMCTMMRRDEWRQTKRNLKGGKRIDCLSSVEEAQHINYSHVQ